MPPHLVSSAAMVSPTTPATAATGKLRAANRAANYKDHNKDELDKCMLYNEEAIIQVKLFGLTIILMKRFGEKKVCVALGDSPVLAIYSCQRIFNGYKSVSQSGSFVLLNTEAVQNQKSKMRRTVFDVKRRYTQKLKNAFDNPDTSLLPGGLDDEYKNMKKLEIQELKKMLVRLASAIKR